MDFGPHKHTCGSPGSGPRWVGDPIDVITGHNVFSKKEFTVPGPVGFQFRRIYNHTWASNAPRDLGIGFRHSLDEWLRLTLDGLYYYTAEAAAVRFPFFDRDGQEASAAGFRLLRVSATEYRLARRGKPTRVFRQVTPRDYRLETLEHEGATLRLLWDSARLTGLGIDALRQLRFIYGRHEQIEEIVLHVDQERHTLMRYRYDEARRLVQGEDAYKQRFSQEFDVRHRLTKRVDATMFAFTFEYDDRTNRCVASRGQDGLLSVELDYRIQACETLLTDANGQSWLYEYDLYTKRLLRITDPLGGETVFEYARTGGLLAETDPAGRRTTYLRDAAGGAYARRNPNGTLDRLPEPRLDKPSKYRVPSSPIEWEYGDDWNRDFGMPRATELPPGLPDAVQTMLVTSQDFRRGRIEDVRDAAGLLTLQRLEDGRTRRYVYSHRGKLRRYRDFDGSDYRLDMQRWDLPHREQDPNGAVCEYAFSKTAEMTAFTDATGSRTEWTFDPLDRITAVVRNGVTFDQYARDGSGLLTEKRDGNGALLLTCRHDHAGRLLLRTLASGDEHTFDYDERGNKTQADTLTARVRFEWDFANRRLLDERDGQGVRRRFQGEHLAEVAVLGFAINYHRAHGDLFVVDPTGHTHRIRLHGAGVFTREFANGWHETAQYHPRGWCLGKAAWTPLAPDRPWTRRWHYSGEGDLLRASDSARGATLHTYDKAHRLVGTKHPDGRDHVYAYTPSNSLKSKPSLEQTSFGQHNQVWWADGHRLHYDIRGHIGALETPAGTRSDFTYDSRDQLVAVSTAGRTWWRADYDAIGRRIWKEVRGQRTIYHWDGDRLAAEVFHDGRLRIYVYPDAFSMVPMLFVDYASESADPSSGEVHAVFTDQRGCPEKIVDARGVVVWEATVEPYGLVHVSIGQDFHQPLRFPGHWWDPELALHYNRFRYYSPWLGRYWQADPIGEQGDRNIYAYPRNPLVRVDVRGLNDDCGDGNGQQRQEGDDKPDENGQPAPRTGADDSTTRRTPEEVAQRMAELGAEGHGPQRHGPAVTDAQLRDRAVDGIDPMTGTTQDGVHGGEHKCGRNATRVNSDATYVLADDHMRNSPDFDQARQAADEAGDSGFVVERPLSEIYGEDYLGHVSGVRRNGSKNNPTGVPPGSLPPTPSNFENGTMKAVYRRAPDGTWRTHTMYPNPSPENQ